MGRLFDDIKAEDSRPKITREESPLDTLKDLDGKIAVAINKVKLLKEEKSVLERRVRELEGELLAKDEEIRSLSSEKTNIKDQITDLLNELENIETE